MKTAIVIVAAMGGTITTLALLKRFAPAVHGMIA